MLFVAIGVKHLEDAARVAKEEVEKGAQLIELCGAFGVSGTQKVINGIDNVVPVEMYSTLWLTSINCLNYLKGIRNRYDRA